MSFLELSELFAKLAKIKAAWPNFRGKTEYFKELIQDLNFKDFVMPEISSFSIASFLVAYTENTENAQVKLEDIASVYFGEIFEKNCGHKLHTAQNIKRSLMDKRDVLNQEGDAFPSLLKDVQDYIDVFERKERSFVQSSMGRLKIMKHIFDGLVENRGDKPMKNVIEEFLNRYKPPTIESDITLNP